MTESMCGKESRTLESASFSSIYSMEQMAESENPKKRLQAAFLQHSRGNANEAEQLLASVGDLNSAAIELSHEMINDIPSQDPRWESSRSAINLSQNWNSPQKSLLIQKQLLEKSNNHSVFIAFIGERVGIEARAQIAQDGEKLAAAHALRQATSNLQPTLDEAIQHVIRQRAVRVPPALTKQDIFYSQVRLYAHFYR